MNATIRNATSLYRISIKVILGLLLAMGLAFSLVALNTEDAYAEDPATEFATRLYWDILDRTPDAGLATQVNALRSGWKPAEIAYNYFNSKEYFDKHEPPERTVERIYQVMFNRGPDDVGGPMWASYLTSGKSIRSVVQGFSEAKEYKDYFGSRGLEASTIPLFDPCADRAWDSDGKMIYAGGNYRDLNPGVTAFASRMYTVVLNRKADAAGLNAQTRGLLSGMPCWRIASNFFGSEKFENAGYQNHYVVITAYLAILGRPPSQAEANGWVKTKEEECLSNTDIVLHFCNSPEFNNLCKQYGMVSGMSGPSAAKLPTPQNHTWNGSSCTHCGAVRQVENPFAKLDGLRYIPDDAMPWFMDGDKLAAFNTGMNSTASYATFNVIVDGMLFFDWEVSSEYKYDGIAIYRNFQQVNVEDWETYTGTNSGRYGITLDRGDIFSIAYVKDIDVSKGKDCAWISNPVFMKI